MKHTKRFFTYPKIAALGFAALILLGSALLMLPVSSKGGHTDYANALFTAVSATCITGLVPFDTFTHWTLFGQLVLLLLIQTGGLGFITLLSVVHATFKKRMGLRQKMLLKDSIGSLHIGDVKSLVKQVLQFTAACESAGAILLAIRFVPLFGVKRGIYTAVFTAISAYCNAGFDLMGQILPSSSLVTVNGDAVILITVALLILCGGLGFIVWADMRSAKFRFRKYSVHTKLMLLTSAVLIIGSTALFWVFEGNRTFADMSAGKQLLNAFFCAVTPRTAGFNSVPVEMMTSQSKMLTVLLMFIGGGAGSTAGGVKVTTLAVLVLCLTASIKNEEDVTVFDRKITLETVKKAVSVVLINFFIIFFGVVIISLVQPQFTLTDILFECTSAIGTVGITAGITPQLNLVSQTVIMILMYLGRLTSLIFALSFVADKPRTTTQKPKCNVMVG